VQLRFIRPNKPVENAFVESFKGAPFTIGGGTTNCVELSE
jgi:hypothetical protein